MSGDIDNQKLLAEIEDVLRSMPPREKMSWQTPENYQWFGRANAVLHMWDFIASASVSTMISKIQSGQVYDSDKSYNELMVILNRAHSNLRLKTTGPIGVAIGQGRTFEYFDELRKIIGMAHGQLLFIDPYMGAEFASKYFPLMKTGVEIRLLTKVKVPALVVACDAYCRQENANIQIRTHEALHDRFVFVDNTSCYQSGASFKDGGLNASTTLTQLVDIFPELLTRYNSIWAAASVAYPLP